MSTDLKATYNQIAKDWHKDHQQDDWWVKGTNEFIKLIPQGGLVLDVGCGTGTKSNYLIKSGLRVVGVDFSEQMIAIARREVPSEIFLSLDLSEIGSLDYVFDGVFAQAVLLHIPKREVKEKFGALIKKLKIGGHCYVAVKEKKSEGPDEEVVAESDYGYDYKRFFSYFTTEEIREFMKGAGLSIVYEAVESFGRTRWVQVVGRKN